MDAERERAVQKAVDDYLLMERKARVLDQLTALLERDRYGIVSVDSILNLVHPAQNPSD